MNDHPANEQRVAAANIPLGLFVFLVLYGGLTVLAGVLAFKQVQLWPTQLAVESGIFAFLGLVVISSTITQLYGEKLAKQLIWWGFLPLAVSTALIFLVLALPPSPEMVEFRSADLQSFETVLAQTPRIMMAGPAAYIVSLLLNVWIFSRLRGSGEANTLGLMARGAIASALSQAIDSGHLRDARLLWRVRHPAASHRTGHCQGHAQHRAGAVPDYRRCSAGALAGQSQLIHAADLIEQRLVDILAMHDRDIAGRLEYNGAHFFDRVNICPA